MSKNIQAVRGMNDILPTQTALWQKVETILQDVVQSFGYREIRFPIVESTELFKRSIGEVTDIVEKEMYTFSDRNGDSLTLRPEGTAVCVRACIEHNLLYNQEQRLWYLGPMYRHERPQKGRYRQFYQMGVEIFGIETPDADAELIALSNMFWQRLGISQFVTLQLNSLGSSVARIRYREHLVSYFKKYINDLDEDSKRRLVTNPLRILDSKNPDMQNLIQGAPKLFDYLDHESKHHFDELCAYLDAAEIKYEINPRLVRGLDYYCRTAFEWVTTELGSQGTICGGGRYDDLVEQLGGRRTPAIGFALGLERLLELCEKTDLKNTTSNIDAYLVMVGEQAQSKGFVLAQELRQQLPDLRLLMNCGDGSFKNQFKRADRSNAEIALILGDDEIKTQQIGIKFLRAESEQQTLPLTELVNFLQKIISTRK